MSTVGIDEVGRGSIAGPVVACAVILPDDFIDDRIIDSKKISELKREKVCEIVLGNALDVGIGVVCNRIIDKINIRKATKQAMHLALGELNAGYCMIIVDAVKLNNIDCEMIHPIKADENYVSVSAASIVAKVYRDSLMKKLHSLYPIYEWNKNKGYGTKKHLAMVEQYGLSLLHRETFIKQKNVV